MCVFRLLMMLLATLFPEPMRELDKSVRNHPAGAKLAVVESVKDFRRVDQYTGKVAADPRWN